LKIRAVGAKWSEIVDESAATPGASDIPWEVTKLFSVSLNAEIFLKSENSVCSIQTETRFQNVNSARA
jgi:hypothetical protein